MLDEFHTPNTPPLEIWRMHVFYTIRMVGGEGKMDFVGLRLILLHAYLMIYIHRSESGKATCPGKRRREFLPSLPSSQTYISVGWISHNGNIEKKNGILCLLKDPRRSGWYIYGPGDGWIPGNDVRDPPLHVFLLGKFDSINLDGNAEFKTVGEAWQ